MAVTAIIRLTQGSNSVTGSDLVGGLAGGLVTVSSGDNTDVDSWSIELLEIPPGSGLSVGVLAAATSATPVATFTPDVTGSYRIELTVVDNLAADDVVEGTFAAPPGTQGFLLQEVLRTPRNTYADISANYTLTDADHQQILHIDSSSGVLNINLPDDLPDGFWCQLRLAVEGNAVTVVELDTSALESVDAVVTLVTRNKVALLEHRSGGAWFATGLE